ncbi:hypothetical protein THAPSDRAFT_264862 [Thalassiosira pseudonana CCMP1335]
MHDKQFHYDHEGTEEELQHNFDMASKIAKSFKDSSLDQRDRLMLYGLYKQAVEGDRNVEQPSRMNVVATAKYDAWGKFTGLPKRFAMAKYSRLRNAAIHNDVTSLQQAMDNGANLDGSDDSGQTALHFAADRGSIACIKLLLEAGADVNALDNDGIGVLQTAVSAGDVVVVRLLLEAGADPDAKDEDEDSPRSCVLDERDKDMMELFALFPAKV